MQEYGHTTLSGTQAYALTMSLPWPGIDRTPGKMKNSTHQLILTISSPATWKVLDTVKSMVHDRVDTDARTNYLFQVGLWRIPGQASSQEFP